MVQLQQQNKYIKMLNKTRKNGAIKKRDLKDKLKFREGKLFVENT